jgi:hypothetical protein
LLCGRGTCTAQEAELQAAAIAREQAAQISTLQKELIK